MALYYLLRWSILVLLGLLVYAQTFGFGFVFDDYNFIVNNPFIKNFSAFHVMWHAFPLTRLIGMYSFALNYHFNQLNPRGYHIFNFLVHLVNAGLVWALAGLLFRITKSFPAKDRLTLELPFVIAVLFLVHPCQTQAVTYITQRFESMATMFYLATIYTYLRARIAAGWREKIIFIGLAVLCIILGVLTKEVVITLPVMVLALEWILFPEILSKRMCLVLVGAGLFLCLLFRGMIHTNFSIFLSSFPSGSHDGDIMTPVHYFLTQMRVFLTFMRLLVLPVHQNLDYDYPSSRGLVHPPLTLVGIAVIMGIIFGIIKLRRQAPLVAFGLAWILVTFSINLAPRSNVIFEHKLYLISFGFLLATVTALSMVIPNRLTLAKILICLTAILAIATFERNRVWANELTLWEDVIKKSPEKARVNANLGRVYGSMGRYNEAIYYLSRAIAISPDNITYENRGVIYSRQGRNDLALNDLNTSIAMEPTYFSVYVKRSWIYQTQHNYPAALADLAYAIQLEPYFADAYIERGMLWIQLGKMKEALDDFQKVLNMDPLNAQAIQYRSYCLTQMGRQ